MIEFSKEFFQPESRELIVSASTKRLWAVLLDLYAEFARVCKKNDLKFYADSGTMIGALRHNGFIPWDDDIDLLMPRSDYEKLCRIAAEEFSPPYFWQTNQTDPGSCRGHAQFRNSFTTGILKGDMVDGKPVYSFNQGIFIDVFPLDNVPDDRKERNEFCGQIQRYKNLVYKIRNLTMLSHRMTLREWLHPFRMLRSIQGMWFRFIGLITKQDYLTRLYDEMEKFSQKYNKVETECWAPVMFRPKRKDGEFYKRRWFESVEDIPFEMLTMPIPKCADEILRGQYGDWHVHVIGGSAHGGMLIDVDRPYTYYLEKKG